MSSVPSVGCQIPHHSCAGPSCNAIEHFPALAGNVWTESLIPCLFQLRIISIALFLALTYRQQSCMTWREYKVINKVQALLCKAIPYNIPRVFPAEFTEVFCLDNDPHGLSGLHV